MLKPSRSAVNTPSGASRPNDPANQKKYTSHSASPNAKRMLSPARDRRLRRIVASSNKSKPPHLAHILPLRRGTSFYACRRGHSAPPLIVGCNGGLLAGLPPGATLRRLR